MRGGRALHRLGALFRSSWARRIGLILLLVLMSIPLARQFFPSNTDEPDYEGYHEPSRGNTVTGWAWDRNHPNVPIDVTVDDGKNGLVTVRADQFRKELLDQGKGKGDHGFVYTLPNNLKDGKVHLVWVRIAGSNRILQETPRTVKLQR